eukprot:2580445-Pleurochrysis_carterae.AAC.1
MKREGGEEGRGGVGRGEGTGRGGCCVEKRGGRVCVRAPRVLSSTIRSMRLSVARSWATASASAEMEGKNEGSCEPAPRASARSCC